MGNGSGDGNDGNDDNDDNICIPTSAARKIVILWMVAFDEPPVIVDSGCYSRRGMGMPVIYEGLVAFLELLCHKVGQYC